MNSINEADKPKVTKLVVVYSGRFQPFHKGHYATYSKLVSKFGANNVYIGTSNDTSSDKSPFNFNEKKKIATTMFGIPSSKFLRVGNPYAPKEILSKFDGKTTQYIAAVGEKDANRLHGKYFKPYNNKMGYGYDEIGYVYPVPAEQNPISGTDVRNGLGSDNAEKSKKFFLKAYPKFDKDIYKMITGKLNESVNTEPSSELRPEPHPTRHEIEHPEDEKKAFDGNKAPYDPISELLGRVAAEEIFKDFIKEYFNEAGNKALDVDISYTNSKGEQKKIKARDALRLPKEHPAHIQASKIAGPDDAPANEPKKKEEPGKAAAQSAKPAEPGQPVKKDQTAQGKADKAKGDGGAEKELPPPNKLSGAELKSSAEKPPVDPREKETKQQLDKEVAKLPKEDQATAKEMNDPNSESRKSTAKNIGDWFKKKGEGLWDGAKEWAHEKKEMVTGSVDSVKSLINSGGKLGYAKNEETGKYEYSKEAHHKQKHALKHLAKDVVLLGVSMVGAAAIGGAIHGAMAGHAAVQGAMHGAVHGVTGLAHHGATGFAAHLGKDLVKHSFFETMGLAGPHAAGATAAVGVIGSLMEGEGDDSGAKFVDKVVSKTLEKMSTYQMSNQQMLDSVRKYNENKPKKDLEDLIKENISETKQKSIQHFVEWATGRLKLKEQPKVNLIGGGEFAETKTSLGGYNPQTKEIYVAIEGRLGADILRTIAHEMVHRKQDEMGLVRNESDGNDGSPIENNAHAVAGILMREYGRINKQIYTEDINIDVDKGDTVLMGKFKNKKVVVKDFGKDDHGMPTINGKKATTFRLGDKGQNIFKATDEVSTTDWHYKAIMKLWDKAGSFGRKKIAAAVCANPHATRNDVAKELRYSGYRDVSDYTDKLGLHEFIQKKTLNELTQGLYAGTIKIGGHPVKIEVELLGADNKTKEFLTKVIHIDKQYQHKLPIGSTFKIPARVFRMPGGGWYKIKSSAFKESINEAKWEDNTYKKCMLGKLPLSLNIVKKLVEPIRTSSLHATDIENLPKVTALQGTKKSISTFTKTTKWGQLVQGKGMHTKGGIIVALSGVVLAQSIMDLWTEPDGQGRRWVNPGTVISGLGREQDVVFNFAPELKPYKENWKKHSLDGTITNQEKAEFIKKYYDAADRYMLSKKKEFQDKYLNSNALYYDVDWNEVVLSQIKIEKILAIPDNWDGDAAQNEKTLKQLKQKYPKVEVAKNEADIQNFINNNGGKVIHEDINQTKDLIMEGGAYGHMSHPFDDMDLTFGDLKNIISKALEGDLGVVREKTDGQALAISWKNGRLIAARNKSHLQNAGAGAMGIADVASKFGGRGALTDAYNFAMRDLTAAISSLSEAQRKKIFNDGRCFMNLEVIWPTSVNVIPYGQAILVFHNTTCYDDKGTAIGANQGAASQLAGMIKQVNADVQSKYTIQGPPVTSIPKNENLSGKQGKYLGKLSKLQSQFGLADSDNVANYHQAWWENFINTKSPEKVDKLTRDALVRRWAFGEKAFRLDKNNITNEKILAWAINNDKVNVAKQQKDNIRPFEEIFLGVGADILDFVSSVLTVHPDKAIRAMKDKFKSVANQVRTAGSPAQVAKLKAELGRLNKLGGVDRIVASEGLVFFYGGKTYKLTGTFAPLNQILGIFYA